MTNDNSPEFFYFDMGNVLLSFDYDIAATKMAQVCGATPEVCRQVGFEGDLFLGMENGELAPEEFHALFSAATGTTSDCRSLLRARSDMFTLLVPTSRIVTQLKAVRRRIGLLSNTSPDHFEFCREKFGVIRDLFDFHILSYEANALKPDPKIYNIAIEKAAARPEKIFFVDDREENVSGARAAGLDAVLFTGTEQLLADLRSRGVELNL